MDDTSSGQIGRPPVFRCISTWFHGTGCRSWVTVYTLSPVEPVGSGQLESTDVGVLTRVHSDRFLDRSDGRVSYS